MRKRWWTFSYPINILGTLFAKRIAIKKKWFSRTNCINVSVAKNLTMSKDLLHRVHAFDTYFQGSLIIFRGVKFYPREHPGTQDDELQSFGINENQLFSPYSDVWLFSIKMEPGNSCVARLFNKNCTYSSFFTHPNKWVVLIWPHCNPGYTGKTTYMLYIFSHIRISSSSEKRKEWSKTG